MTAEEQTEVEVILDDFKRGLIGETERDEAINAIAARGRTVSTILDLDAA